MMNCGTPESMDIKRATPSPQPPPFQYTYSLPEQYILNNQKQDYTSQSTLQSHHDMYVKPPTLPPPPPPMWFGSVPRSNNMSISAPPRKESVDTLNKYMMTRADSNDTDITAWTAHSNFSTSSTSHMHPQPQDMNDNTHIENLALPTEHDPNNLDDQLFTPIPAIYINSSSLQRKKTSSSFAKKRASTRRKISLHNVNSDDNNHSNNISASSKLIRPKRGHVPSPIDTQNAGTYRYHPPSQKPASTSLKNHKALPALPPSSPNHNDNKKKSRKRSSSNFSLNSPRFKTSPSVVFPNRQQGVVSVKKNLESKVDDEKDWEDD